MLDTTNHCFVQYAQKGNFFITGNTKNNQKKFFNKKARKCT